MRHARLRSLGWQGEDVTKPTSFCSSFPKKTPGIVTRNINGLRIFPPDANTTMCTNPYLRKPKEHGSTWSTPQRQRQRLSPSIFWSIPPSQSYPNYSHNISLRHHPKARETAYRRDMPSSPSYRDRDDKLSSTGLFFLHDDDRDKHSAGFIDIFDTTEDYSVVGDVTENESKIFNNKLGSSPEKNASCVIDSDFLDIDDDDKDEEVQIDDGERDEEITLQVDMFTKKSSVQPVTDADISDLKSSTDPADAQAQFELAERFASRALPGSFKDAADLYAKAAKHGHSGARNSLAVCYEYGWGVTKNLETAMKLYFEGAETGDWSAQRYLGDCYKNGKGVPKDIDKAYEWYAKAGDADAISNLEKFSS